MRRGDLLGLAALALGQLEVGLERLQALLAARGLGLEALARGGLVGGEPVGLDARVALGGQQALERAHRLAALAGAALGLGAAGGQRLLVEPGGLLGRRRRPALAAPGDGVGEVDERAAAGVQGEGRAALDQRDRRAEGRAPARRLRAGERGGVLGAGQRGEAVGAAAVVDDQHRRREALALVGAPASGQAQQRRVRGGGDVLEALDVKGGRHALRRSD